MMLAGSSAMIWEEEKEAFSETGCYEIWLCGLQIQKPKQATSRIMTWGVIIIIFLASIAISQTLIPIKICIVCNFFSGSIDERERERFVASSLVRSMKEREREREKQKQAKWPMFFFPMFWFFYCQEWNILMVLSSR